MITADIQGLEPGAKVELFELDLTEIGGDVMRFHGYLQAEAITWQGLVYSPWPIEATGFGRTSEGSQPSPTLSVGNVDGSISAMCAILDDMVGAKLIRHTTLGQYLDAENFEEGNPAADPSEEFPLDVWYIEQKTSETDEIVVFELSSGLDFNNIQLPGRTIIADVCTWQYRDANCNYTGAAMFDASDNPVSDPALDRCGKRLSSCRKRFGEYQVVNFGGFPGAGLMQ